jgi:protein TonB
MFTPLIESAAPARRRTPRFFLLTLLLYTAVLAAVVVCSIVLYQPSLADTADMITMVTPLPPAPPGGSPAPATDIRRPNQVVSAQAIPGELAANERTTQARALPTHIPAGPVGDWTGIPGVGPGPGVPGGREVPGVPVAVVPPPPAAPPAAPESKKPAEERRIRLSDGVIQGNKIYIPTPKYPQIALITRQQGEVRVEIVIDKSGRVISATAVSGPPLLRSAAAAAALQGRFRPTLLSGEPVVVQGVIVFRFTLGQ